MKRTKKVASLFLALILALSVAIPALAAGNSYSITINKTDANRSDPHVYEAYQIFAGDLANEADPDAVPGTEAFLNNITWGSGVTYIGNGVVVGQDEDGNNIYSTAASDVAAALVNKTLALNDLVADLELGTPNAKSEETDKAYVISGLEGGYYLVKDDESCLENDTPTEIILEVVENSTISPKAETIKIEKKVDDENDSLVDDPDTDDVDEGEDSIQWHDSADHDIGDLINFKLSATIPSDFSLFKEYEQAYKFVFHDTEEAGLTFQPDSVEVYVDDTKITTGYTVKTEDICDGETFEVVFDDLTAISDVKAGTVITVLYQSELNEDAIIGSEGNVNEVYGEFANFYKPESPKVTPKDTVIVFTYQAVVNKTNPDGNALSGAQFTLEKFVADEDGDEEYNGVTGTWVALKTVETQPDTTFSFSGLDDGEYRLTETKAPEGYNAITDSMYFTVEADHDTLWEGQDRLDVLSALTGEKVTGTVIDIEFEADVEEGLLETEIVNNRGPVLPETGGIGTTIFYIIGGILVVGAIILLITKKRMKNEA